LDGSGDLSETLSARDGPASARSYILRVYGFAMSQIDSRRERRINVRVSEQQERTLRDAAELTGESLPAFVLSAATEHAEDILARSERIEVGVEAFERFVAALEGPVEEMPAIRRYARQPSPIPGR
jgi:uncharacterized protein (DUF1778 family)